MLATLTEPFNEPGWLYEIKWDGYRAIALMNKSEVNLVSRNNISFNDKYPPVYEAIKEWGIHAIVDGEIVVMNKAGKPDFGALQNWRTTKNGRLYYYVFDLLWLDGYDLTGFTVEQRRALLRELIPQNLNSPIRFSENFSVPASELLDAVGKMGMEGIIAKQAGSTYYPGQRSTVWVKMKNGKRQEVVIGGFTQKDDSPRPFSSLLTGVFEKGVFRYVGRVGTGFSISFQKDLMKKFIPLIQKKDPFDEHPDFKQPTRFRPNPGNETIVFLKPKLVCEVNYAEITEGGIMRQPSFAGLRDDKAAKEVTMEMAVPVEKKHASKH